MTEQADKIVSRAVERSKTEIEQDISSGRVPSTVASFSELHDYVDANEYGGLCDGDWPIDAAGHLDVELANAVQDAVDAWLKAGRISTDQSYSHPNHDGLRARHLDGWTCRYCSALDTFHGPDFGPDDVITPTTLDDI